MSALRFIRVSVVAVLCAATASACDGRSTESVGEMEKRERIAAMYEEYQREFPDVPAVTAEELARLLESDRPPVLVDARSEEERAVSTIPGAIAREEFESRRDELRGREVVTYCTIGYRSGLYAEELREQGLEARNLAGSILAWTHEGLSLEAPDGSATERVHVYGARWNLAAEGYEAVW